MFKRIKRTSLVLGIALTAILGMSYGIFIFTTNSFRSTEMLVGNLTYGIEITSTGGSETINGTSVSLTSGKTSTVLLKITSLNKIISKYGIDYKMSSGTGSVKYASNTGWLPTGKINENNVGTYEKIIKVVISATTDVTVDFTVTGGYSNNDLIEVKEGYTRLTEVYDGIVDYKEDLKTIISKETTNNIYGGEAINNYLQYPTNTDATKNIWRVLGYYNSVDGIKAVSNQTSTTATDAYIGTSAFNSSYDNIAYVSYMYGSLGSVENARANTNNSTIKTAIDNWYATNLNTNYGKYISTTAVYCNDRTYTISGSNTLFGAYTRLRTNKTPTYDCTDTNDKFTVDTSTGNGKLKYPIALMTADEVSFAGGLLVTTAPTWYYYNSANGSSTGTNWWWSLSPYNLNGSGYAAVFGVNGSSYPGRLNGSDVNLTNGVRPAISLKSCIKYSTGDGSAGTPYTIEESTSGC